MYNREEIKKIIAEINEWVGVYQGYVAQVYTAKSTIEDQVKQLIRIIKEVVLPGQIMVSEKFAQLYVEFNKFQDTLNQEFADYKVLINGEWRDYKELINGEWEEVQRDLYSRFDNLYKFVHDYFDNLNVQNEVDDIILRMAADGRLEKVIDEATLNNMKWQISQLHDGLSQVVSGSPKGTFDSLDRLKERFPDGDSGIYIVGDDWYYWSYGQSEWMYGGVYQSSMLGEKAVTSGNIEDAGIIPSKTRFIKFGENLFDRDNYVPNCYMNTIGYVETGNTNYFYTDFIEAKAGNWVYATGQNNIPRVMRYVTEFDYQKKVIRTGGWNNSTNDNGGFFIENNETRFIVVTSRMEYIALPGYEIIINVGNYRAPYEDFKYIPNRHMVLGDKMIEEIKSMEWTNDNYFHKSISYDKTDFMTVGNNLLDHDKLESGYINVEGVKVENAGYFYSNYIYLPAGESIVVQGSNGGARYFAFVTMYDVDLNVMPDFGRTNSTGADRTPFVNQSGADGYVVLSFAAANFGNGLRNMVNYGEYPMNYEEFSIVGEVNVGLNELQRNIVNNLIDTYGSELYGKKIANLGDSINAGDGNNGVSYVDMIVQQYGMIQYKYALGGATITSSSSNNVMSQVNRLISSGNKPDIIIIGAYVNDIATTVYPLGNVTEGYGEGLSSTTFSGSMENIFKTLKKTFHYSSIIYVRSHNMRTRGLENQQIYGERAKEICKKWGVPFVDLFEAGQMNTWLSEMHANYTNNQDGTHPNAIGYEKFYVPPVKAALKALV